MNSRFGREQGVTLMELLIAVTLLSLLSIGMFLAMRLGISAFTKADDKLMTNRRAAGAQRILIEELKGLVPVMAFCGAGATQSGPPSAPPPTRLPFFQGQADVMRLVSNFSLEQGWRGRPKILEMFVISGEHAGVRLVVNEVPYRGPVAAGQFCTVNPQNSLPQFLPVEAGPRSFVLADLLAYCRFWYLTPPEANRSETWKPVWQTLGWPRGVRVEMAPLEPDPSRVQPITVTAPIYVDRHADIQYGDL